MICHHLRHEGWLILLMSGLLFTFSCGGETKTDPPKTDSTQTDTLQGRAPVPDSQSQSVTLKDTVKADKPAPKPAPAPRPIPEPIKEPGVRLKKPVIYLYPDKEMVVNLKLDFNGEVTVTYPPCDGEWTVKALPGGELVDLSDGASLQYLYYEGDLVSEPAITSGFVVPREETVAFLRQSLAALGLTPREYNDMITYWLPELQKSRYNAIHFTLQEQCDQYCRLNVSPAPDSHVRVMMEFVGMDSPVQLQAQELPAMKRSGFTLVEWGGVECSAKAL